MSFHSEYGEDAFIAQHLKLPERGFYVDAGAGHPTMNSNTAFLRERGWSGLVIDADDHWKEAWNGELITCLLASQPAASFVVHIGDHWCSRIEGSGARMAARTLESVLQEHHAGTIDLLSLDIEGQEFDVFQTMDRSREPGIIIAEYNTLGIGEDFRLRDHLLERGYRAVHQTVANLIYTKSDP